MTESTSLFLSPTLESTLTPGGNYPDTEYPDSVKKGLEAFLNYTGPFSGYNSYDIRNPAVWMDITNGTHPCEYFSDTWTNASVFFNCTKSVVAMSLNNMTNVTETTAGPQPKYGIALITLFSLLASVVSIVTILGNLLVLVAFFVDRSIRQPSNYFIASLAVSDFIIGLFSMPLYTMYELLGYWPLGPWICDLWLSLDYTVCLTSQYTVFFITLDRFCSVKIPAKYRNWRTEKKILVMVAVTWILPTLVFFISIIGWQFFVGERTVPQDQCYVQFADSAIFNTVLVIGYYWITLIVMCGLYTYIYHVAWSLQRKSEQKHKKMTSIVNMGNAMSKLGLGMANNVEEKKKKPKDTKTTKKPIKASKKYSTTSFQSSKDKEENSSAAYASDSESNTPKPSPKHGRDRGSHAVTAEDGTRSTTLLVPAFGSPTNGVNSTSGPPKYVQVVNNNINGDVYKEFDNKNVPLPSDEAGQPILPQSPPSTLKSSNVCQAHASDPPTPDSPIWKKRHNNSANNHHDVIMSDGIEPHPGVGTHTVDTISEHANGKTVTKVVPQEERKRRFNININSLVQRISNSKILRRGDKEKVKKSKSENRARKALRVITLILGAFVLFWTPYHVVVLINGFCPRGSECVTYLIYAVTYWLCYCNSPLNPFCYAASNQNFKKVFTRILKGDFRRR